MGTAIENLTLLYEDIVYQNAKDFKELRESNFADAMKYLKKRAENNSEKYVEGYAYVMDWVNLISPRYYIQGVDITLAMREKLFLDEEENESIELVKEAIREYEIECFNDYLNCLIGQPTKKESVYEEYLQCIKKVNTFPGIPNAVEPQKENPKAFRELVKQALNARKKCQVVVSFTNIVIPPETRVAYNKKTLTYDEALDICQDIIDNVSKIAYTKKGQSLIDAGVDADEVKDMLVYGGIDYNEQTGKGLKNKIMENFPTNFLDQCGVLRRIYNKYFKNEDYFPNKKFALALGLFLEPYSDLSNRKSKEVCIWENLERFMNQNCLSVNSSFSTVTEYDVLLDDDIKMMLQDGLPVDAIAFLLNNYAKTLKDSK